MDLTNAEKDGAWDSSYVSTGVYDQIVNDTPVSYTQLDVYKRQVQRTLSLRYCDYGHPFGRIDMVAHRFRQKQPRLS